MTPSRTADWINFTGATPSFSSQRTLVAWEEGHARQLAELEDDKEGKSGLDFIHLVMNGLTIFLVILISNSPPNSSAIKVEDADLPDLGEINDGLMANGEQGE
jgi:hypothetical protein